VAFLFRFRKEDKNNAAIRGFLYSNSNEKFGTENEEREKWKKKITCVVIKFTPL
jgi:hypothetical protein